MVVAWLIKHKIQQHIGAGVFIPETKTAIHVNPGGVGISNTINRADLTGIASALRAKCTHIATDGAYSLSQKRRQLLFLNYTGNTHMSNSWNNLFEI